MVSSRDRRRALPDRRYLWQTETGGILITPLPGATKLKPGSATEPFFGVVPEIVDADGKVLEANARAISASPNPWPGMMRTVYGDHARFEQTYFSPTRASIFTGDGCRRDADGYYWITGRVDDVIKRLRPPHAPESSRGAHAKSRKPPCWLSPRHLRARVSYAYDDADDLPPSRVEELRKELVAGCARISADRVP